MKLLDYLDIPAEPPKPTVMGVERKGLSVWVRRFHPAGGLQGREESLDLHVFQDDAAAALYEDEMLALIGRKE